MRTLIVGCGYVGISLGADLVRQGHEVFGLRRSREVAAELSAAGIQPVLADITRAEDLERLPERLDWVVNCVSSNHGGVTAAYAHFIVENYDTLPATLIFCRAYPELASSPVSDQYRGPHAVN